MSYGAKTKSLTGCIRSTGRHRGALRLECRRFAAQREVESERDPAPDSLLGFDDHPETAPWSKEFLIDGVDEFWKSSPV